MIIVIIGFGFLENNWFYEFFNKLFGLWNMKNLNYGIKWKSKFVDFLYIYCKFNKCCFECVSDLRGGVIFRGRLFKGMEYNFVNYVFDFGNGCI